MCPALIQNAKAVEKRRLKDGLKGRLERRPSVSNLVEMNIIPEECTRCRISPALVATRRKVMREALKDGLRAWLEGRARLQQSKEEEVEDVGRVRLLARKFTTHARRVVMEKETVTEEKWRAQIKWGREVEIELRKAREREQSTGGCAQPTRAHVLGLRRFWEGVIRAAAG